jgi:hypothetical protein
MLAFMTELLKLDSTQDSTHSWSDSSGGDTLSEEMRLAGIGTKSWIMELKFRKVIMPDALLPNRKVARELSTALHMLLMSIRSGRAEGKVDVVGRLWLIAHVVSAAW